jgi:hypothetical protein
MSKKSEWSTTQNLQQQIRLKYGDEAIRKAKERLCYNCKDSPCFLLPITSDGSDCPYFQKRPVDDPQKGRSYV